jgi:hypothetical protein
VEEESITEKLDPFQIFFYLSLRTNSQRDGRPAHRPLKTRPKRSSPFVSSSRQRHHPRARYQKPCRRGPLWKNQLRFFPGTMSPACRNNETCRLEQWQRHASRRRGRRIMEGSKRREGLGSEDSGGGRGDSADHGRRGCGNGVGR